MDYTVSPGKIAYGILFTALLLTTVCFGDVPNSDPVRPGREFVYVATSYHISQFRIGMDGTLIPLLPPMAPIQNSSGYDGGPISLSIDKGQRFVYVPYLEADRKKIQSALLPGTPNSHPLDFLKPMIL